MVSSVGPYRVLEKIGQGGMGEVFLAEDRRLRRRVALKRLTRQGSLDSRTRHLVLHEARAAAALNHTNIAAIYDVVETDEGDYIVMEFVEGESLSARLREKGPLPVRLTTQIGLQLAEALAEAHGRGIVHRDIKPGNVMLTPAGRVKVLDFGLARRQFPLSDPESQSTPLYLSERGHKLLGTPAYLPPECLAGRQADARSDIYCLGVTLYEMLAGRRPYGGPGADLHADILNAPIPSARSTNPDVPESLDAAIRRAMHRDPSERFATAEELGAALRHSLARMPEHSGLSLVASTLRQLSRGPQGERLWLRPGLVLAVALAAGTLLLVGAGLTQRGRRGIPWGAARAKAVPADASRWFEAGTAALRSGSALTAARSLEKALALHDDFPLAHARLAEARAQIDDLDGAREALLRLQSLVPDLSSLGATDALYLTAVRAMVSRRFNEAVAAYETLRRDLPNEIHVLLDLGRAQQANGQPDAALASFEEGAKAAPDSPAAHLCVGEAYGNANRLGDAQVAFQRATDLFQTAGNFEGVALTAYQWGTVLNRLDRTPEAKQQLERALRLATETDNAHLRVRCLLQLSSLAASGGETGAAETLATQAIGLAEGMESLAANGLIDLGNAYFVRDDLSQAELRFQQALTAARRHKAHRTEARALLSLASLRLSQGRGREVEDLVAPALVFYAGGGYRQEELQALGLRGEARVELGHAKEALAVFERQAALAGDLQESAVMASALEGLGRSLAALERFPEACERFERAERLLHKLGYPVNEAYVSLKRGLVLAELGQGKEAETVAHGLAQALTIRAELAGLRPWLAYLQGTTAAAEGRFEAAVNLLRRSVDGAAGSDARLGILARVALSLASVANGRPTPPAIALAERALESARALGQPQTTVRAGLALAQIRLAARQPGEARILAEEMLAECERASLPASAWRAALIMAAAEGVAATPGRRAEGLSRSTELESRLSSVWGAPAFSRYKQRADIAVLVRRLTDAHRPIVQAAQSRR